MAVHYALGNHSNTVEYDAASNIIIIMTYFFFFCSCLRILFHKRILPKTVAAVARIRSSITSAWRAMVLDLHALKEKHDLCKCNKDVICYASLKFHLHVIRSLFLLHVAHWGSGDAYIVRLRGTSCFQRNRLAFMIITHIQLV